MEILEVTLRKLVELQVSIFLIGLVVSIIGAAAYGIGKLISGGKR